MDFGALPPEINSGNMYAGPGSGPMLAAAAAWSELATELYSMASSFQSVISELTSGPWLGPSSAAMVAAAVPYVAWMSATAAQAEQTALQANAAARAFETAFAMTVPPPVVAANRASLMSLIATNFLGQNTPAIAANEADYHEMWAQDATAMYGYAAASAAAAKLAPFTPPTHPTGLAGQLVTLAQVVGQSLVTDTVDPFVTLYQLLVAVPPALQGLVSPAPSLSGLTNLVSLALSPASVNSLSTFSLPPLAARIATTPVTYLGAAVFGNNVGRAIGLLQTVGPGGLGSILGGSPGTPAALGAVGASSPISAGLGQAPAVGGLSVPPSWAAAAPAVRLAAAAHTSAETAPTAAPAASTALPAHSFGQSLLGALAGRALTGVTARARISVMPRVPAGG
ncbi:PPE family protein [Mycobacterium botniense]|uniref:Putative PPE family protein PPE32 n=1 Tax=Mycobacterium botniense TaxID=84962 RepID=A0A7I9XYW5_9MYCO|nr:PPE family protein [Mycobacterium botniense]GFG75012.1 putative PPE family protein PPE32 [Mycobacterium botniense]